MHAWNRKKLLAGLCLDSIDVCARGCTNLANATLPARSPQELNERWMSALNAPRLRRYRRRLSHAWRTGRHPIQGETR